MGSMVDGVCSTMYRCVIYQHLLMALLIINVVIKQSIQGSLCHLHYPLHLCLFVLVLSLLLQIITCLSHTPSFHLLFFVLRFSIYRTPSLPSAVSQCTDHSQHVVVHYLYKSFFLFLLDQEPILLFYSLSS